MSNLDHKIDFNAHLLSHIKNVVSSNFIFNDISILFSESIRCCIDNYVLEVEIDYDVMYLVCFEKPHDSINAFENHNMSEKYEVRSIKNCKIKGYDEINLIDYSNDILFNTLCKVIPENLHA